ncbi:hypothetical protein CgunFtcFv8_018424 [Champsocephalus gunnari]|uniref:Uncharacterized protein n=1 Tax=Champsocephalus gunnari TaxID=52237 RepID=A0AAN8BVP3_CHAGU|nr:hypothetical protein CgunFtcFv8_018424 [Champsocephalus gunnari]
MKDLKYLKSASWVLSTWNWSEGLTSTTEALELKAMLRNLQRPETRLSRSPTVTVQKPSPPEAISTRAQLSFNPQNMTPAGLLTSEGEQEHAES